MSNDISENTNGRPTTRARSTERNTGWKTYLLAIGIDVVLSVLLEIGTLAGYHSAEMHSLSRMMPKRLLVFFVITCIPSYLIARRILTRDVPMNARRNREWGNVIRRTAITICAGIGGALVGFAFTLITNAAADWRFMAVGSAICMSAALLVTNAELVKERVEYGFAILALAFGISFCLLMPVAAEISWDGHIHFDHANALSYLFDAEYTQADQIMCTGGEQGALFLLGSFSETEQFDVELESRTVAFPHANLDREHMVAANNTLMRVESEGTSVFRVGTKTFTSESYLTAGTLGRIPNAFGLWIGRLLHTRPSIRYLLARVCNVIAYVAVFFFAIRALKRGKLIMAAIGLCPTSLLMAANFAYDPWHISFISLSIAQLVGALQQNRPLETRDSLRMLVPFVLGTFVKAVFFPIAILFAIIPKTAFSSKRLWRRYLILIGIAVLLLLASFALPFLVTMVQGSATGDIRGGSDINPGAQISYVISHPFQTFGMGLWFAIRMLNPARLGFAITPADENLLYYSPYLIPTTAPLNEFVALCEFLLLATTCILDGGPEDSSFAGVRYKIGSVLATGLSFTLVAGSMYVAFTTVGRDTIAGVQYRYLLPLLAPLLLLLPNTALRRCGPRPILTRAFFVAESLLLALVLWNSFFWQM